MNIDAALQHFKKIDPVIHAVLQKAVQTKPAMELPVPKHESEYFPALVRSIIGQQISIVAARTIYARLEDTVGMVTYDNLQSLSDTSFTLAGVSKQKLSYIKSLISLWPDFEAVKLGSLSDDEIRAQLTKCHGIGVWTADMFMIFTLGRPDIYSFSDLVLQKQLAYYYSLVDLKKTAQHEEIVSVWSPHKSLASLALWHSFK